MQVAAQVVGQGAAEFLAQGQRKVGRVRKASFRNAEDHIRAVAQVHHHARKGFIHGQVGTAVARNSLLVPQGVLDAFPQNDSYVLHRVVGVHLQVAAGLEGQVHQGMASQQIQHVVKKRMARGDGGAPGAVQVQFHADVRFTGDPFARSVPHVTLLYRSRGGRKQEIPHGVRFALFSAQKTAWPSNRAMPPEPPPSEEFQEAFILNNTG